MTRAARWASWTAPVATLAAALIAWELVVDLFAVPEYLLPPPTRVARAMAAEWRYLLFHTWVTTKEILLGFALAVLVGIPTAVAIVSSPTLERAIYPLLVASQSVPKIAIAPLLIFWAGIGTLPKVLVAFLISFFPIIIDTVVGRRSVEPEMLHLARSMGAGERRIFVKIRFPSALPNIFAGLKVAVTLAVVGAIVGEFIQADQGLGYALLQGQCRARFGYADATTMAKLVSKGLPVKMIANYVQTSPMSIISFADKGIKGPKDLEGKKVSFTAGDSLHQGFPALIALAKDYGGLDPVKPAAEYYTNEFFDCK